MPENAEVDPLLSKLLTERFYAKQEKLPGLTEGRIVHYVLPEGPNAGDHRPAVIVKVWENTGHICQGYCNLMVFLDGHNDGTASYLLWKTSKCYSENKEPDTWHWIEKA